MSIKLVMLKSGEDLVADVKEIKSNDEVIGYYFEDPLIIKLHQPDDSTLLTEDNKSKMRQYLSRVHVTFYPWIPLSKDNKIPCSADWVVTIVEPIDQLKFQYQEQLNERRKGNQDSIVINE